MKDLVLGNGEEAMPGRQVVIFYKIRLNHGQLLREDSACFTIGKREIIAGLEKGVIGMRVGGKRHVTISPHLAYGDKGLPNIDPPIPPKAVLHTEIDLLEVKL